MHIDEQRDGNLGFFNLDSSDTKTMARSRGGQFKHWAETARILAWYYEVKRRCDWTDYKLDNEFAWTEEGKASYSSAERPRTFEWIRKKARKPAGRDKRWRGMTELVDAVDQHPLFPGTKNLYNSLFWTFLQEETVTRELLESRMDRLLQAKRLSRVPFEEISATSNKLIDRFGLPSIFDRCLRLSFHKLDLLSAIELLWLLYQQNEPAHNWEFRSIAESLADHYIGRLFTVACPNLGLEYYSLAIKSLLQTRLEISSDTYGSLKAMATWPVIPTVLVGEIEEAYLLSTWERHVAARSSKNA